MFSLINKLMIGYGATCVFLFVLFLITNDVHRLKNSEPEPSEPRLKKLWALDWAWIENLEPEPGFKI